MIMKCYYKSAITSSFGKMVHNHPKIPLLQTCWETTRSVLSMESINIFHTAEHLSMVQLPRNDFLYCVVLIAIQILIVIDADFKCVDVTLLFWVFISMLSSISTEDCFRSSITGFFQQLLLTLGSPSWLRCFLCALMLPIPPLAVHSD